MQSYNCRDDVIADLPLLTRCNSRITLAYQQLGDVYGGFITVAIHMSCFLNSCAQHKEIDPLCFHVAQVNEIPLCN